MQKSSAPFAFSRGLPPQQYGRSQLQTQPQTAASMHPPAPSPAKKHKPSTVQAPPTIAVASLPQAQRQPQPQAQEFSGAAWTSEQMSEAKKSAKDLFDAPLNEAGKHRVRVTTYGPTVPVWFHTDLLILPAQVGVDLRDFFLGQYGDLQDKWLPGKKGIRLRPEEWTALKAVSGDIDAALAYAGYIEQPVGHQDTS